MTPTGFSPGEISSLINRPVVEEHAEEAAFLWRSRERASRAPHYRLKHLAMLDARLLAHLEGLRVAGDYGLAHARHALADADASVVFVAAYLAFAASHADEMRRAVQVALSDVQLTDAVVAALAWLGPRPAQQWLNALNGSENAAYRRLAIAVQAAHRDDGGAATAHAVADPDPALRARALRSIGETKRRDLDDALHRSTHDAEPRCRFWGAWSLAVLGHRAAAKSAFETASEDPALASPALEIAMRAGEHGWARQLIRSLAGDASTLRQSVVAAGAFGDPATVPWLLQLLEQPRLARVAGEALASITGADLEQPELKQDAPEDAPEVHEEDLDLRWPSPDGLARWWHAERGRFVSGQRYIGGQPLGEAAALHVLRTGYQRQRRGAAIELALLRDGAVVFPVHARGDWQRRRLAI